MQIFTRFMVAGLVAASCLGASVHAAAAEAQGGEAGEKSPIAAEPDKIAIKLEAPRDRPVERRFTVTLQKPDKIRLGGTDVGLKLTADEEAVAKTHEVTVSIPADHTGIRAGLIVVVAGDAEAEEGAADRSVLMVPFAIEIPGRLVSDQARVRAGKLSSEQPARGNVWVRPAKGEAAPEWLLAGTDNVNLAVVNGDKQAENGWPVLLQIWPGREGNFLRGHVRVFSSLDPNYPFLIPVSATFAKPTPLPEATPEQVQAVLGQKPLEMPEGVGFVINPNAQAKAVTLFVDMNEQQSRKAAYQVVGFLTAQYRDKVQIQVVQNPDGSNESFTTAQALEAAQMLGGASAFFALDAKLDGVEKHLDALRQAEWEKLIQEVKLPARAFLAILRSPQTAEAVTVQSQAAKALGLKKTPAVFFEGRRVQDWPNRGLWISLMGGGGQPSTER